jgi:hypothetical protein
MIGSLLLLSIIPVLPETPLHLTGWGRAGDMHAVTATVPRHGSERLELVRGEGVVEWFASDPRGVEHGFDVERRAPGEGELVLEIESDGFAPVLGDGGSISLVRAGRAVLSYSELFVVDAEGHPVPARMTVEAGKIVIHVDDRSARYPLVVDPLIYAVRTTLVDSASPSLGKADALQGTTALVGSDRAVTFFTGSGTTWTKEVRFPNLATSFGSVVALDGDNALAGSGSGGPVQFYARKSGVWTTGAMISGTGGSSERFGQSVAISGSLAIVGAPILSGTTSAGSAYIYAQSGGAWTQQAKVALPSGTSATTFGQSVAISGTTALVLARTSTPKIHVYEQSGTTWTDTSSFRGTGSASFFGLDLAMSATTAIAGDTTANSAYVFVKDATGWTEQAKLAPAAGDTATGFGSRVAIDGDRAVVLASSALFVFERTGTTWTQKARFAKGGADAAISGSTLAVGADIYGLASSVGDACAKNDDCAGLLCVDGVCCSIACTDKCKACSNALTGMPDGTCALAKDGKDPHADCVASGSVCASGTITNQVCNGAGACRRSSISCAPFMCTPDGKGCASSCSADTDCAATQYCSTTGVCTTRVARGDACKADRECASRFCVDGVCCDTKCDGQCQACAEPGSVGSCVAVKGAPRAPRTGCAGVDPACAGACDGTDIAGCSYPSAGRTCGAGCVAGSISVCDATGTCLDPSPCSGNLACDAPTGKCKTACVGDEDCASGFVCGAGKCAPKPAPPPVHCSEDRTASVAPDGTSTPCSPYRCGSDGSCPTSCATSGDCLEGSCDTSHGAGVCVPPPVGDDGGCAFGTRRARSFGLASLLALVALGRARRRRR